MPQALVKTHGMPKWPAPSIEDAQAGGPMVIANAQHLLNRKKGGRGWDTLAVYLFEAVDAWLQTVVSGSTGPHTISPATRGKPDWPQPTISAGPGGELELRQNIAFLLNRKKGGRGWDEYAVVLLELLIAYAGDLAP